MPKLTFTIVVIGSTLACSMLPMTLSQEPTSDKEQQVKARRLAYASDIEAARQALEKGNVGEARKKLASTTPVLRGWEHDYLLRQTNPNEKQRAGHKRTFNGDAAGVRCVEFTRDNRLIIGSVGKVARVWDFTTDKSIELVGHQSSVLSAAVSPDGKKFATGSWDGFVFVWDAATGKKLIEYQGHNPANKRAGNAETLHVHSLCFSPDGKQIVSAAYPNSPFVPHIPAELKIWSVETGKTVTTMKGQHLEGRHRAILDVTYSPDGKLIATGEFASRNQLAGREFGAAVRLWDAGTGKELRAIQGHTNNVLGVAFSPDGKRIASASTDKTLGVWDVETGKRLLHLRGHALPIFSVRFSPDGKRIVSGSWDKTVRIWDASTGTSLLTLAGMKGPILSIAISPDGKRIAAGGSAPRRLANATVWDSTTPSKKKK